MRPLTATISSAALASIREEIAATPPHLETGGILLGMPDSWSITVAGRAGPGAVRTPTFFLRDLEFTQQLAAKEAEGSGAQWLGEWHTHPTGPPRPSRTDLHTYATLQDQLAGAFSSGLLSLIITPIGESFGITAWSCTSASATQLHIEEES